MHDVAHNQDYVAAVTKAGVAVGGTTYSFFGLPFSDLAAILTCVYIAIQIGEWIYKKAKKR